MQYPFTEDQLAIAELTRNFMEREVAPVAVEIDARPDPKDCYPRELINKASKLGLRTIAIPEEYGGMDADLFTKTLALWEGAQIEIGTIKCLSQCWKATTVVSKAGTKAQKDRWLANFAADDDAVCSLASTEPDHSTENRLHGNDPKLGMRTMAVKDGDHFVINGAKRYTSLIGESRLIVLYARTDPDVPVNKGMTAFLLDGSEEGITFGRTHNKMGYRLYPNRESYYDNVRVHKDNILGEVNGASAVRAHAFRGSAELAACNTGLARSLYQICYDHAKERVQGGKPIIEHLTVRHMLAEMIMNIEVAEQFMWRICWGADNDETYNSRFTRYGKVFSDQMGLKTIALSTDILGAIGIMKDNPVEKMIRDLITFLHGDGTDSLTLLRAAQTLDEPV
ncbi:MAG: acyl-CoA dehydrogenase family protein [Nitrospinota bacterium]|nr:acyl-CoA dehydrogenase family protein [Nitrospinota bacterium]